MGTHMVDDLIFEQYMWASQKDVFNYGVLLRPIEKKDEKIPVILAVWDNGTTEIAAHESFIRTKCAAGNAVFVLDASGMGNIEPQPTNMGSMRDFYGTLYKMQNDLMWIGDSLCAMRVYDVLRAVEMVKESGEFESVSLYAEGFHGVYAKLAYTLAKDIETFEEKNVFESFSEWINKRYYTKSYMPSIILPGILNYFDLTDVNEMAKL